MYQKCATVFRETDITSLPSNEIICIILFEREYIDPWICKEQPLSGNQNATFVIDHSELPSRKHTGSPSHYEKEQIWCPNSNNLPRKKNTLRRCRMMCTISRRITVLTILHLTWPAQWYSLKVHHTWISFPDSVGILSNAVTKYLFLDWEVYPACSTWALCADFSIPNPCTLLLQELVSRANLLLPRQWPLKFLLGVLYIPAGFPAPPGHCT